MSNSLSSPAAGLKVAIFHNIMWSKYKGGVFSAIHEAAPRRGVQVEFTQIAETEGDRVALGAVDMSYHRYPHELVFKGAYGAVPTWRRALAMTGRAWRTQADVVVLPGYERLEFWAMLAVLMLRGKRRAVFCDSTVNDKPQTWWKSLAKRAFFSRCHGFFGYGVRSKEYLMLHGAPADRIYFRCQAAALPHGYNPDAARAQRLAAQQQRNGQGPLFLYVGRLSHEKGLDTLLTAFSHALRTQPGARLELVGAGPLRPALEAQARAMGLDQQVRFLGSMQIDALATKFAEATALVLPSTSEPWGLVVNEAMSYGCPAIVSEACGCVPELVLPQQTGLRFATSDIDALADCLLQAPAVFADHASTAARCIGHIQQFSPQQASAQILEGCTAIHRRFP